MPKITYIEPSGSEAVIDVPEGWTLMQGATANGVDGIEAECGGSCACATCHCYVDGEQASKLAAPAANELAMLENVAAERKANSRLSCQIKASAALDGLVVRLPERQS
jgi:ferredoxin, 2Fe-2S